MNFADSGGRWRAVRRVLLVVLAVVSFPGTTINAANEDGPASQSKAPTPKKAQRLPAKTKDPRSFPKGITVLVDGWKDPRSARDYPGGLTVVGAPPASPSGRPVIRIMTPPGEKGASASPAPQEEAGTSATAGLDLLVAPADRLREEQEADTTKERKVKTRASAGPSLAEQLEALGQPPLPGGAALSSLSAWSPTPSWPERDTGHPYPWNPARFAPRSRNASWEPTAAWQTRKSKTSYPWNAVHWSDPLFDPTWLPSDSWGRVLQQPEAPVAQDATTPPPDHLDATREPMRRRAPRRSISELIKDVLAQETGSQAALDEAIKQALDETTEATHDESGESAASPSASTQQTR